MSGKIKRPTERGINAHNDAWRVSLVRLDEDVPATVAGMRQSSDYNANAK